MKRQPIKIVLREGSKGAEIFQKMLENKRIKEEKFKKQYEIPEEIRKFIKEKADATEKLNSSPGLVGGPFNKGTFILGMHSMYFHLKDKLA